MNTEIKALGNMLSATTADDAPRLLAISKRVAEIAGANPVDEPPCKICNHPGPETFQNGAWRCPECFGEPPSASNKDDSTKDATQLKWLLDIRDDEIIHLHSQMAKALTDKEEAVQATSGKDLEIARLRAKLAVSNVDRDRAIKDRDEAISQPKKALRDMSAQYLKLRDSYHSVEKERDEAIATLNKQIARETEWLQAILKADNGRDEALELKEQAIRERDVLQQLLLDLRKQTGWRQFKDQKPTMDDSDARGCVMMCGADGLLGIIRVRDADQFDTAWWRPTMSPVTLTPLGQWMQTLTPSELGRFNVNGNLSAIWESINKFNQKQ